MSRSFNEKSGNDKKRETEVEFNIHGNTFSTDKSNHSNKLKSKSLSVKKMTISKSSKSEKQLSHINKSENLSISDQIIHSSSSMKSKKSKSQNLFNKVEVKSAQK